jgi:NodT family efflux transporter outer membrane factor (OMF) lipoprotein
LEEKDVKCHYPAILAIGILVPALAGCSLAPEFERPAPPVPAAAENPESPGAAAGYSLREPAGWRDFFSDSRLIALIEAALDNNRDVKMALFAIGEARAEYRGQRSMRFPMLDLSASDEYSGPFRRRRERQSVSSGMGGMTTTTTGPGAANSFEIMAMGGFDLDLFGGLASMSEAARQNYLATVEAEKMLRIALIAEVAKGYLEDRLAAELLRLAESTRESRGETLGFVERRVQSGQSSALDLEMARGMVEEASAMAAMGKRDLIMAANALKSLVGVFTDLDLPEAVPLAEQKLGELPDGIPSEALLALPEIREAEYMLRMAHADIGAARAAFFPSVSLTGRLGYMSDDLKRLFNPVNGLWSFLPAISVPIFNGGRNRANLDLAELRKEKSAALYEKRIQTVFRMVSEALQAKAALAEQTAAQERYLAAQRQVLTLATGRYLSGGGGMGAGSYLEILDAQRNVFEAERELLRIRRDQLANSIDLYAALGGGLDASRTGEPLYARAGDGLGN